MTITDIITLLECKTYNEVTLEPNTINGIIASDLMSDALVVDSDIDMLVTSLATAQALRTADIIGAKSVLVVNGKLISDDMVEMAKELNVLLLGTALDTFSACGLLHKQQN